MFWPRHPGHSSDTPIPPPDQSGSDPSALGSRPPPRRALAILGVLVAVYATVLGYRSLPGPAPVTAALPASGISLPGPAPQDLGWVRANPTAPVVVSPFRFTEITRLAGIDFVHESGMTAEKHFPTAYGSGVAILDADGDGWLDLYFANATRLPVGTARSGSNRLYRNLGGGRFRDVTGTS